MHTTKLSDNFLVNAVSGDTSKEVLQIALRLAKTGKKVTYIAAKAPESLPFEDDYDETLYRGILKNIMFKYTPDSRELINFFPTMHKYTKPEVIIVDFMHTFFDDFAALDTNDQLQLSFMDAHMLMAGALHAAADGLSPGPDKKIISIICIDPQYHSIYQRFIQIFVDSYFFKEGAILSIEQMMQRFS